MSSLNSLQRGIRQRARRQRQEAHRQWRRRLGRLRNDTPQPQATVTARLSAGSRAAEPSHRQPHRDDARLRLHAAVPRPGA